MIISMYVRCAKADIGILYLFCKRETDSELTAVEETRIPGRK